MRNENSDPDIVNDKKPFSGNPYMRPYTKKEMNDAKETMEKIKAGRDDRQKRKLRLRKPRERH
jgi:hypothetical protein